MSGEFGVCAVREMLAAVWLALSACFFAALLALQVPLLKASCGAPSLNLVGIFQDLIRYGKTKAAGGQRPVLLQIFDVPKRWFYHFYIVSVTWNGFLLLLFMQCVLFSRAFPFWIRDLLDVLDEAKEDRSVHHSENGGQQDWHDLGPINSSMSTDRSQDFLCTMSVLQLLPPDSDGPDSAGIQKDLEDLILSPGS